MFSGITGPENKSVRSMLPSIYQKFMGWWYGQWHSYRVDPRQKLPAEPDAYHHVMRKWTPTGWVFRDMTPEESLENSGTPIG